jgi:hypothetical protein
MIDFLHKEHASTLEKIKALTSNGEITFDLLWAVFLPGLILYTCCSVTSEPRAFRLREIKRSCRPPLGTPYWELTCEYVDACDDSTPFCVKCKVATKVLEIDIFDGVHKIHELAVYPIEWHPNSKHIQEQLINRGRKWVTFHGVHHLFYDGTAYRNE